MRVDGETGRGLLEEMRRWAVWKSTRPVRVKWLGASQSNPEQASATRAYYEHDTLGLDFHDSCFSLSQICTHDIRKFLHP